MQQRQPWQMFKPPLDDKLEMNVDNIQELFYIVPIKNLNSILGHGLLSHRRATKRKLREEDISNNEIQERRKRTVIERVNPNKHPKNLHRYVNLYLNPHNAMMINVRYEQAKPADELCILRISADILKRGDVVLTDRNAATDAVNFYTSGGFHLDEKQTRILIDKDCVGYCSLQNIGCFRQVGDLSGFRRQTRQAEVLVPYAVDARHIFGIWVASENAKVEVGKIVRDRRIEVNVDDSGLFLGQKQYQELIGYNGSDHQKQSAAFDDVQPDSDSSEDENEREVRETGDYKRLRRTPTPFPSHSSLECQTTERDCSDEESPSQKEPGYHTVIKRP